MTIYNIGVVVMVLQATQLIVQLCVAHCLSKLFNLVVMVKQQHLKSQKFPEGVGGAKGECECWTFMLQLATKAMEISNKCTKAILFSPSNTYFSMYLEYCKEHKSFCFVLFLPLPAAASV